MTTGESRKLLFVAPSAYPLGGVQVWLDYIMPGLRDAGWRVELALTAGAHHDVGAYLAQHPFAPAHAVAAPTGTQAGRRAALRDCILAVRPDMVVGVNIADVYAAAAEARATMGQGLKVVATLHGLQPDFLADFAAQREFIDAAICPNRLAQRLLVAHGGMDEARALYAPYGVDGAPRESDMRDGPLRLAYVGRIENEQKRTDDLVELLARAKSAGLDAELLIAGGGPDEAALRKRVDDGALGDRVHFLGVLSQEETAEKVYAVCDGLVITSIWETGPIVAWEAMIRGVPILTSDYVGRRAEGAFVDGENALIFPVGDIDAALAKLRQLMSPQTRRRLAENGRALIAQRYTRAQSIAHWHSALSAVMALPTLAPAAPPAPRPSGRFDALFGVSVGERLRRLLGRSFTHAEPGGEWPHAYGVGAMRDAEFWSEAARLDAMEVRG